MDARLRGMRGQNAITPAPAANAPNAARRVTEPLLSVLNDIGRSLAWYKLNRQNSSHDRTPKVELLYPLA